MGKHTPGPWRHAGRKGGWDGVTSADGTDICALEYNNPANARLIAAAPDLLEALLEARAAFVVEYAEDGRVLSVGHDSEALRPMVATLDAAIAKATGETQTP